MEPSRSSIPEPRDRSRTTARAATIAPPVPAASAGIRHPRVRAGVGASTFRYDGDGRRVERVAAGATTRFLYDGDALVAELSGSNAVTLYRAPGVGYVRAGSQRYEQESSLGSLLTARDASGSVTGQTEYDAYGREVYAAGSDRGDLRFAGAKGYVNDDASGMQLLGARYYVPVLGRFLTQDPIGHEGGLNLYAYCNDSPLNGVDPKGTETRSLKKSEFARLGTAADFLCNNGFIAGSLYKVMLQFAPDTFQVDTDIGGAAWRFNKLYLGPHLFDQVDYGNRPLRQRTRDNMQVTDFEDKAWFASILYHEFDHVVHNETYFLFGFQVGGVERRAWGVQIGYLNALKRSLPSGSPRAARVGNLIDRAKEGRNQY